MQRCDECGRVVAGVGGIGEDVMDTAHVIIIATRGWVRSDRGYYVYIFISRPWLLMSCHVAITVLWRTMLMMWWDTILIITLCPGGVLRPGIPTFLIFFAFSHRSLTELLELSVSSEHDETVKTSSNCTKMFFQLPFIFSVCIETTILSNIIIMTTVVFLAEEPSPVVVAAIVHFKC